MGQVVFLYSGSFEFLLPSKLQDPSKQSQDKNTLEARIVKNVVDQKNQLQSRFGLLGRLIRCVENLAIVGWSIGIQLT
jgi:hypothetical protein